MTAAPFAEYLSRAVQEKVCGYCERTYVRRPRESTFNFEARVYCSITCRRHAMWVRSLPPPRDEPPEYNADGSVNTLPWMNILQAQRPSAQKEHRNG